MEYKYEISEYNNKQANEWRSWLSNSLSVVFTTTTIKHYFVKKTIKHYLTLSH